MNDIVLRLDFTGASEWATIRTAPSIRIVLCPHCGNSRRAGTDTHAPRVGGLDCLGRPSCR